MAVLIPEETLAAPNHLSVANRRDLGVGHQGRSFRHAERLIVGAAMLLGLLVRLRFVLGADFPLHQGGLFYVMARELQRAHYALPSYTAYNNLHIPFAYPPLALYITALTADLTHSSLFSVLTYLPLVVNVATIGAFYLLARALLGKGQRAYAATFAFALVPAGFVLLIEGGGITRSFGLLFSLLALWQLQRLCVTRQRRYAAGASLFCGLMLLSHIEFGMFVGVSAALVLIARRRDPFAWRGALLVAAGTLLVISPWLLVVIARHGIGPFTNSLHSGDPLLPRFLLLLGASSEGVLPVIALCAVFGVCARRARALGLPVWLVALYLVDSRGAKMYGSVPLAMLAGLGAIDVLLPMLRLAAGGAVKQTERRRRLSPSTLLLGGLGTFGVLSALSVSPTYISSLSHGDRSAMQWVAANAPRDARFLVIGGDGNEQDTGWSWELDRSAEWFPALTGRTSVTTYEGHEWLGDYGRVQQDFWQLVPCTGRDAACLDDWSAKTGRTFDYVYIPQGPGAEGSSLETSWCCWSLRNSLRHDTAYKVVYDGPGATVLARRP